MPAPLPAQKKQHVHKSYIWLGGIQAVLSYVFVFIIIGFGMVLSEGINFAASGTGGFAVLMGLGLIVLMLVIFGITIGALALSYKHFFYELGEKEFNVYSGIFNKKRVHIPYQRVQAVNQKMTLIQRLFGVCTLTIDTAGGSTNKAVSVPYVQNFEAERLRRELFERKRILLANELVSSDSLNARQSPLLGQESTLLSDNQPAPPVGSPLMIPPPPQASQPANILDAPADLIQDMRGFFGGSQIDTGAVTYEYRLTNKELLLTGLSNNMAFVFSLLAVIGSLTALVGQVLQSTFGRSLASAGLNAVLGFFQENFIFALVILVLLVSFAIWLFSAIGTCISFAGFKARRRQTRIEVEHGLIQHQLHGVDIDRVQSVIIKQGFIRRLFGYCELSLGKIDALTSSESSDGRQAMPTQGLVVHPFVKFNRVPEILQGLAPEFADIPTQTIALPKVSLRRALIRRCILHGVGFWIALFVAIFQVGVNIFFSQQAPFIGNEEFLSVSPELSMINMTCIALYALCVAILFVEAIGSVLWHRKSSFAFNDSFMQITNGGYSIESVSFPRKKIQFGTVRTNPFQRSSQVATIIAVTAAGISGTATRIRDVQQEDAQDWLTWLLPRAQAL